MAEDLCIRLDHLETRIIDLEQQQQQQVRQLNTSTTPPPHPTPFDQERVAYQAQMKLLREDFMQERADRERQAGKAHGLEMQLNATKLEYNKLNCKLSAIRNAYRALYTRTYGVDPNPTPVIECDAPNQP